MQRAVNSVPSNSNSFPLISCARTIARRFRSTPKKMPGNERQPSSPSCLPSWATTSGLIMTMRCAGSLPPEQSITNRSEEHTSELQSLTNLVCRLLLEKKKKTATSLSPMLSVRSGEQAIEFYKAASDANEGVRIGAEDNSILRQMQEAVATLELLYEAP